MTRDGAMKINEIEMRTHDVVKKICVIAKKTRDVVEMMIQNVTICARVMIIAVVMITEISDVALTMNDVAQIKIVIKVLTSLNHVVIRLKTRDVTSKMKSDVA